MGEMTLKGFPVFNLYLYFRRKKYSKNFFYCELKNFDTGLFNFGKKNSVTHALVVPVVNFLAALTNVGTNDVVNFNLGGLLHGCQLLRKFLPFGFCSVLAVARGTGDGKQIGWPPLPTGPFILFAPVSFKS